MVNRLTKILITLLATRNIIKDVREKKLAKLGIGRKNSQRSYERVTTISVPDELPADKHHPPTGETVCPHLRRGHIRRQPFGPQLAFFYRIWVQPVLVNADRGFVSKRIRYNLSL
jgi:hypothetical protein